MNSIRKGKDLFEKLTTLKVVRQPQFPLVSLKKRYIKVRLDFTKGCNLRCVMCPTVASGDFERREMPPELFRKIAKEVFPRAEHLTVGCGAEPLLAKNFDEYLQIIRKHGIPYTLIISNGSLLTESKANSILDAGIDEVSISLESANREVYESIRIGAKFERLVENLNRFKELKVKRKTERPKLSFNTVLMKSTLPELMGIVELAKSVNATAFAMAHLIPFSGLDNEEESLFHHQEIANAKITEARELAESQGIRVFCPPLFGKSEEEDLRPSEKGTQGMACIQPWTFMVIDCDGKVSPCGWFYGEMQAGAFKEQSFRQIWFGTVYSQLREEIRTGNLRSRCAKCPAAGLGNVDKKESFEQISL